MGIAVLDYGMGNLHSIKKALERVSNGERVVVTYDRDELRRASKIVFPGVGGIRYCVDEIRRMQLDEVIREAIEEKPVLCICIGMQSLMSFSEENDGTDCLDIFPGNVRKFQPAVDPKSNMPIKVPHMGWNRVYQNAQFKDHPLWQGIGDGERFYFVHSYYVEPQDDAIVAAHSEYPEDFCCAMTRKNLFAVQFHPEKSGDAGLKLLSNFVHWDGAAAED